MSANENGLRLQQDRLENERRYKSRQLDKDMIRISDNIPNILSEEIKLRKQHERLENEKEFYKKHSYLTKERRLSLPERGASKSAHNRIDMTNVKSRLFDYEKSAPRSRRQLAIATDSPSPKSPLSRQSPMRAIDTNMSKETYLLSLTPDAATSSRRSTPRLNSQTDPDSLASTALEREASRRNCSSREPTVSFDERDIPSQQTTRTSRANSLPAPSLRVTGEDQDEDDGVKLQALYDRAIATVQKADESMYIGGAKHASIKDRRSSEPINKTKLDVAALKELETILHDARLYSSRRSSKEDHSRLDLGSNRAQKKRIQHLEQVLRQLNPNYGANKEEYDPMKVLQCSYLRLSKSNIETLETMLRQEGRDPGIHIHTDVTDYDIWQGLKDERTDLIKLEPSDAKNDHKESKKAVTGPAKKSMKV